MVQASVPVVVEAPRELVFELFSDLELMPQWSRTLESVKRVAGDASLSDWSFAWMGVRLGWRAVDTERLEGERISWTAIDGLPHSGRVDFADAAASPPGAPATRVTMSVEYDAAGLLAVVLRSPFVADFVEKALESDLQRFRQFALRTARKQRLNKQI